MDTTTAVNPILEIVKFAGPSGGLVLVLYMLAKIIYESTLKKKTDKEENDSTDANAKKYSELQMEYLRDIKNDMVEHKKDMKEMKEVVNNFVVSTEKRLVRVETLVNMEDIQVPMYMNRKRR